MLAYGEWVEENVLAPVPHRQYVFALPKLLRPWFRHDRTRLGNLCQLIAKLLHQGFHSMAPQGSPGRFNESLQHSIFFTEPGGCK